MILPGTGDQDELVRMVATLAARKSRGGKHTDLAALLRRGCRARGAAVVGAGNRQFQARAFGGEVDRERPRRSIDSVFEAPLLVTVVAASDGVMWVRGIQCHAGMAKPAMGESSGIGCP
jgi:hypothetical protein